MAVTHTASLAQANIIPTANHAGANILMGTVGPLSLSASGSGMILLAKIPAACRVNIFEVHTNGATTGTLNVGVRSGISTSLTASALLGSAIAGAEAARMGAPYTTVRDETNGETYKYVVCTQQAGTVTASFQMNYTIVYVMTPLQT